MERFQTMQDLAGRIGLNLAPGAPGGFESEADWGYRLGGAGRPGGNGGGWLLTFARGVRHPSPDEVGHLIAYDIDRHNKKTGQCVLLRSPWAEDDDDRSLARARQSSWWDDSNSDSKGGVADLDMVDRHIGGSML